jgi:hypothetical protein
MIGDALGTVETLADSAERGPAEKVSSGDR